MRHGETTILKRIALPFALTIALLLPVGAGAAIKLDSDDAAVRIPTAIFGTTTSHAFVDDNGNGNGNGNGKDKCKPKKEDCDDQGDPAASESAETAPPTEEKPPLGDEDPNASWSS